MLTEPQKKLVEDNEKLIYYGINKYGYGDIERFYGAAAVGLCRAAETYQTSKGTKFSTYALRCIRNEIYMECRKAKGQKCFNCLSLEQNYKYNKNDGSTFSIEPKADDLIEPFEDSCAAHEIYSKTELADKQKKAFDLWLTEHKQREIAQLMGLAQSEVSRLIRHATEKMRKVCETENT